MKSQLRILHLEDSATDCELIGQLLAAEGINCEIVRLENRPEFLEELKKKNFDLIFADSSLPTFSGRDALELCRQYTPEIPFIFISGTMEEELAIESLKSGATDYVLKNRLSRLAPAVRRAVAEAEERAKSQEMEQRLRQSQRLEAVGTLAGGVAHDFNNLLTIIKGHVSLLMLETEQAGRVQEVATTINHAAQRGSELVSQLLAFARKSDGAFISTDINQRVREIVAMLKEAMPRNITFELKLDERLPEIHADPGQVERVIINLATNARDAMPNGGRIVFATSQVQGGEVPQPSGLKNAPYLCLSVADTGSGMDEATRQHIFEPFFTTKPRGKGTGLGMPVVYGLMQSHEGAINIESELGKGTTISLYFPIPAHPTHRVVEEPAHAPKAIKGTETVLVVDDETAVSSFVEVILKTYGYRVLLARDAEEALGLLATHGKEIDLLFSDIGLSGLDGFGLGAEARKLNPDLKIMLTSGYADGRTKAKLVEQKINGFIAKPYDMSALLQSIRTLLDKD